MKLVGERRLIALAVTSACLLLFGIAGQAAAQGKAKSVQSEAVFSKYDPADKTVTAKVKKTQGKVSDRKVAVKTGQEAEFNVKPEGSVLSRTTVSINGKKGELTDIPEGKTVNIYWVADSSQPTGRFARKIDIILSEEELNERYGFEE